MDKVITADLVARVCPVCGTTKHVGRAYTWPPNGRTTEVSAFPGTLLDWFAGQALAGMPQQAFVRDGNNTLAVAAYDMAAAMLAEKEKREWVKVEPPPLGKLREVTP